MITAQNTKRAPVRTRWSWPCLSPQHHPSLFLTSLPLVSARWTICMQVRVFCHLSDRILHSLCLEGFSLLFSDVPFKYRIKYYPFFENDPCPSGYEGHSFSISSKAASCTGVFTVQDAARYVSLEVIQQNICWESAHAPGIPHEKITKYSLCLPSFREMCRSPIWITDSVRSTVSAEKWFAG